MHRHGYMDGHTDTDDGWVLKELSKRTEINTALHKRSNKMI